MMSVQPFCVRCRCTPALVAGTAVVLGLPWIAAAAENESPESISLVGLVRDFREHSVEGGHPDFERRPDSGFGLYSGNVDVYLGPDNQPVFTGSGNRVDQQATDAQGRPIAPHMYNRRWDGDELVWDSNLSDSPADLGPEDSGGVSSAQSFNLWYSDHPDVNMSSQLALEFQRQDDGTYVFDDTLDPNYVELGGFFPIDGELFGNSGGSPDHNFHFTFELHTEFTYDADADQMFRFVGDDDVWVFIDGKLAIDLGGVHSATEQIIDLDRMGLEDGETYTLDFFFAERHRTQSNFRIETNLSLESLPIPSVSASFD